LFHYSVVFTVPLVLAPVYIFGAKGQKVKSVEINFYVVEISFYGSTQRAKPTGADAVV